MKSQIVNSLSGVFRPRRHRGTLGRLRQSEMAGQTAILKIKNCIFLEILPKTPSLPCRLFKNKLIWLYSSGYY